MSVDTDNKKCCVVSTDYWQYSILKCNKMLVVHTGSLSRPVFSCPSIERPLDWSMNNMDLLSTHKRDGRFVVKIQILCDTSVMSTVPYKRICSLLWILLKPVNTSEMKVPLNKNKMHNKKIRKTIEFMFCVFLLITFKWIRNIFLKLNVNSLMTYVIILLFYFSEQEIWNQLELSH